MQHVDRRHSDQERESPLALREILDRLKTVNSLDIHHAPYGTRARRARVDCSNASPIDLFPLVVLSTAHGSEL
jgi:hypothetical protein